MDDIKLPEPFGIHIGDLRDEQGRVRESCYERYMPTNGQKQFLYTADQVRAAVLADRERRNADESDALTVAHMCGYEDGRATVKESLTPEQEREAFEAWCTDDDGYGIARNYGRDWGNGYDEDDTQAAWVGWQARAALAKGDGVNADDLRNFPGLTEWLAGGNRGISSNSIVQHLTGLKTLRWFDIDIPHDPADFDRCLQLLDAVPMLRSMLPQMATASPMWAAIVGSWDEIEASHLQEVGLGWTKARSAPKTYALMRNVIDRARADQKGGAV